MGWVDRLVVWNWFGEVGMDGVGRSASCLGLGLLLVTPAFPLAGMAFQFIQVVCVGIRIITRWFILSR